MLHFSSLHFSFEQKKPECFFFTQATKQYSCSANWSILSLENSVLWLCLPEIIYRKMRELYLVENILHRGSGSTKFDCRLQKGANRKYIHTLLCLRLQVWGDAEHVVHPYRSACWQWVCTNEYRNGYIPQFWEDQWWLRKNKQLDSFLIVIISRWNHYDSLHLWTYSALVIRNVYSHL